jgi:hypothetical protein
MAMFNQAFTRVHRIFQIDVPAPGVQPNGHAVASLTEFHPGEGPHMGSASMKVYNVAPKTGFVSVRGEVDWDDDLDIRVTVWYE